MRKELELMMMTSGEDVWLNGEEKKHGNLVKNWKRKFPYLISAVNSFWRWTQILFYWVILETQQTSNIYIVLETQRMNKIAHKRARWKNHASGVAFFWCVYSSFNINCLFFGCFSKWFLALQSVSFRYSSVEWKLCFVSIQHFWWT